VLLEGIKPSPTEQPCDNAVGAEFFCRRRILALLRVVVYNVAEKRLYEFKALAQWEEFISSCEKFKYIFKNGTFIGRKRSYVFIGPRMRISDMI
jgi:hypothetical protein